MSNQNWNIDDSANLYGIKRWGEGFFSIDANGDLCVMPQRDEVGPKISIAEIVKEMKDANIAYPCVIRFHDILRSRVKQINQTFSETIKEAEYNGQFFGVFPIKVNQLREVVEEIVDAGLEFQYGLEAGSKPEIMAVLSMDTHQDSLMILNGYKDDEYLRLALLGNQLGRKSIVVIEKFTELVDLLRISEEIGVEPMIGFRAKLSTKGSGKWADSAGDFAKFGLSIPEVLTGLEYLKERDKLHLLKLFHFHIGSQVPDIRTIKEAITEGARLYTELHKLGAPIEYFDVGGGVGVNYDGSRSNGPSSINYNLKDYVEDVVYILRDICNEEKVPHPNLVTESGRAVTAHHSCVVTNVFGSIELKSHGKLSTEPDPNDKLIVKNMKVLALDLNHSNYQEVYNDAYLLKEEAQHAFKLGVLSRSERAIVENIFWELCHRIVVLTQNENYVPREIASLKDKLSTKYLTNLSVFQSAPDAWAIGQILPVMPIHRLHEKPTVASTIADITCDSDGKLDCFLSPNGHTKTVMLHDLKPNEEYIIGMFMTGAYQDIMGDMHNLFGRLNEVHVYCDDEDPSDFYIEEVIHGNTAAQVLKIMQYSPELMCKNVKAKIDARIKSGDIKPRIGVALADFYEKSINSYTYLNKGPK